MLLLLASPASSQEPAERSYVFALKAFRDGLYDVASEGFREYLASLPPRPQEPEARYFLGLSLLEMGRDEEALESLEAAARADSEGRTAPLARLTKAQAYLAAARYEEAEAETARWLRYFPRHKLRWEVKLLRGRSLAGLKRPEEAVELFEEVAASKGVEEELAAEALSRLASSRAAQGLEEEAARAWRALLDRAPESPLAAKARLQLAARAWRAGRLEEALGETEALLEAHPQAPEAGGARLLRAHSLFGLKRWEEASEAYLQVEEKAEDLKLTEGDWERAGMAHLRAGRFAQAAEALGRAGDGPEGALLFLRFKAHRESGQPAEALKTSSKLLASYPQGPWAHEALRPSFDLARKSRKWDELEKGLEAYLEGAPEERKPEARYLLAHAELASGRPAEAAELLGALSAEDAALDRFPDVRYKLAVALSADGNHQKALETLEALQAGERAAVGRRAIIALEADIHRALGLYSASADRYRALLAQWPDAPEAGRWLLALAETEEARGRPGEALGAYQRWLDGHPSDEAAPLIKLAVARLQVATGRTDEAWKSLEELTSSGDEALASHASLLKGRIALERGDYSTALEASSKAAEGLEADSPSYALARWRMARALEKTDRPAEALSHYRWLAEHAGDDEVRQASKEGLQRLSAASEGEKRP